MITNSDSYNSIESKNFYIILPTNIPNIKKYLNKFKAKKINEPFSYNSFSNKKRLKIQDIRKLIYKKIKLYLTNLNVK